jgi:two-component system response regulator AtoC
LRQLFLQYEWPGNIRELENMMKRLVILQDEQLVFAEIERNTRVRAANAAQVSAPVAVAVPDTVPEAVAAGAMAASAVAAPVVTIPAPPVAAPESETDDGDDAAPVDETNNSLAATAKAASMKAERALIEKTLRQVHWNRRKAAVILGVSYKTLLNKIKECGISRD